MALNVDAMQPGANPYPAVEVLTIQESSQLPGLSAERGRNRFPTLRRLEQAMLLALGLTILTIIPTSGIKSQLSPDSTDASKIPPVPTMMAGNLPDSGSLEPGSPSAEKQEFSKDQQEFIEIMSGILAPNVVGEIKDAFGGRGGLPKQFTVSDSPTSKSYIFQFPESLPGKPGLAMIDVTLLNKDSRLVWHAQTRDQNLPPEFPNQRSAAVVRSEEELARKVENILAQRYKPKNLVKYSDEYSFKVGGRFPTSDGGEEAWGASTPKDNDFIVPGCIYLVGEVIPPYNSEWRIDPSKASGKPDPLQRIPR